MKTETYNELKQSTKVERENPEKQNVKAKSQKSEQKLRLDGRRRQQRESGVRKYNKKIKKN